MPNWLVEPSPPDRSKWLFKQPIQTPEVARPVAPERRLQLSRMPPPRNQVRISMFLMSTGPVQIHTSPEIRVPRSTFPISRIHPG
jgi:hypothetical protein